MTRHPRTIFLCHASEDKARVRDAWSMLRQAGFAPWLDEKELLPGQDWALEIPAALKASAAVVIFFSKVSVSKRGYVQREFKLALDALQEIPEGEIFVIPIRLDTCDAPSAFSHLQRHDWDGTLLGFQPILSGLRHQFPPSSRPGPAVALARHDQLRSLEVAAGKCVACELGRKHTRRSFGRGGLAAQVLVLGEGPGADDEATGLPLAGPAGQLLDKMLAAISLSPDDAYIANVIKCRTPLNRMPTVGEREACSGFWRAQVRLVQPKLIITLGTVASQTVLETDRPISALRGEWHEFEGIPVLPTFHPAYLLRNAEAKRVVWDDLKS